MALHLMFSTTIAARNTPSIALDDEGRVVEFTSTHQEGDSPSMIFPGSKTVAVVQELRQVFSGSMRDFVNHNKWKAWGYKPSQQNGHSHAAP